jgi:hypothetical protein
VRRARLHDVLLACSSTSTHASQDLDHLARDLRKLAMLAIPFGIRIAYEGLSWGRTVNEFTTAWDVVCRADCPNLGLGLDSFHMLAANTPLDALDELELDPDRSSWCSCPTSCGRRPSTFEERMATARTFRVFPGEGVHTPALVDMVRRLDALGYRGDYSFEVFNDDYVQMPLPFVVAARRALGAVAGRGRAAPLGAAAPQVVAFLAAELDLRAPEAVWHTQRDEWLALGCELGLLAGSLGKMAKDIALMGQYEVGELAEPSAPGRGGSSAMPHKRNPVACMVALAASARAPQRVAALLAAMPQEHERALGNWQAELAEWPGLVAAAHGSARAMAQALPGLQVNTQRMRANIETLRAELPADAADEWFSFELAEHAAELARAQVRSLSAALNALKA